MNKIDKPEEKNITINRKARHEYHILNTIEAGIQLVGTEVKSLRQNKVNLVDGYITIRNHELWLIGVHINVYDFGNINNHDPVRDRKLLVHKREIKKLKTLSDEKGNTLIPLRLYFSKGKVKVEIAIAKGKKTYDKREDIKKRDVEREIEKNYKYN